MRPTNAIDADGPDTITFTVPLWRHAGEAAWFFVTMPPDLADEVAERYPGQRRGFGSLRVEGCIGSTVWRTSIFPSSGHASFLLPIKAAVRRAEGLLEGDPVTVDLRLLGD